MDKPSKTVSCESLAVDSWLGTESHVTPCHSRLNLTHGVEIINMHLGRGSGRPKELIHSSFSSFDRLLLLPCVGRRNKVKIKIRKHCLLKVPLVPR